MYIESSGIFDTNLISGLADYRVINLRSIKLLEYFNAFRHCQIPPTASN